MKSYSQFVGEAYSAREELNEILGLTKLVTKGAKAIGSKGFKFSKYAGRRGIGGALAGYSLAKGDMTGTGLGLASMLPGPIGSIAMGANLVRSLRGDHRNVQDSEKEPATPPPTSTQNPPPTTALDPKKDNRSAKEIGRELDKIYRKIRTKMDSGDIRNPFAEKRTTSSTTKQKNKEKSLGIKDIRDRDINARGGYDPRYDR